jgi:hypothetical protein
VSIQGIFWVVCIIILAWFFVSDVFGGIRYEYHKLLLRSIGSIFLGIYCISRLLNLSTDIYFLGFLLGLFWISWFSRSSSFRKGLADRGITNLDLMFFRKPK